MKQNFGDGVLQCSGNCQYWLCDFCLRLKTERKCIFIEINWQNLVLDCVFFSIPCPFYCLKLSFNPLAPTSCVLTSFVLFRLQPNPSLCFIRWFKKISSLAFVLYFTVFWLPSKSLASFFMLRYLTFICFLSGHHVLPLILPATNVHF